ncbi:hypothetical protein [Microbacterium sp. Leaf179]|uniref:hypothetical protein n=1 Tax=Microbacterium sp. Leaf179 TaxID=1736288 RepID=UPI000A5760BC|nr:hypothetical protein [Microbacterium sp. Leaf179]
MAAKTQTTSALQDEPSAPAPRSLNRRLDPGTWKEIVAKYNAGATTPQLCAECNLSKGGLLNHLRDRGVQLRRQPLSGEQAEEASRLYGYGFSIAAIADYLDTSYNDVRQNFERLGIERRPRGGSQSKSNSPRSALLDEQQGMQAVLLYTSGGSPESVAAAVGTSRAAVRTYLLEMGVPLRGRGRPPRYAITAIA